MRIEWQGQHLVVDEVLDAWRSPEGKGYRVRTQDGQIFELHYSEVSESWSIMLHSNSRRKDG